MTLTSVICIVLPKTGISNQITSLVISEFLITSNLLIMHFPTPVADNTMIFDINAVLPSFLIPPSSSVIILRRDEELLGSFIKNTAKDENVKVIKQLFS